MRKVPAMPGVLPVVDGRVGRRGGGRVTKGEVVVVASINKVNNPVNIRLNLCSLQ